MASWLPASRKGSILGTPTARRRRASTWGVAVRSGCGDARVSWQSLPTSGIAVRPALPPPGSSHSPVPTIRAGYRSSFRPFIVEFGSSSLRCSPRIRDRPRPSVLPSSTIAPGATAAGAGRETLAALRGACGLGLSLSARRVGLGLLAGPRQAVANTYQAPLLGPARSHLSGPRIGRSGRLLGSLALASSLPLSARCPTCDLPLPSRSCPLPLPPL
ncbi:hypothetical protein ZWY2020_025501 [Hordeum vulgare]|nr:hypothetical protein ZWY2020_025501 [Hordeum vulgare]